MELEKIKPKLQTHESDMSFCISNVCVRFFVAIYSNDRSNPTVPPSDVSSMQHVAVMLRNSKRLV